METEGPKSKLIKERSKWWIGISVLVLLYIDHVTSEDDSSSYMTYECPLNCSCDYEMSRGYLEVSCGLSTKKNNLTNLPRNSLRHLQLSHINFNYFQTFNQSITELSLHSVTLNPTHFLTSSIFVQSLTTLRKIRILNPKLSHYKLSSISLSNSPILAQSGFTKLQNLDSLSLIHSPSDLTNLILSIIPRVAHLTVFNSSLTQLELIIGYSQVITKTLKTLNVSSNAIEELPLYFFNQFPLLTLIDLSFNSIKHLQENVFIGLTSLRILNLSHNHIQYADPQIFTPLMSLQSLDLSYNQLHQIFEPYFEFNSQLQNLVLRHTWAENSFLDEDIRIRSQTEMDKLIQSLQRIEILDLRDNHMRILSESIAHLPNLRQIFVLGNSWQCSCQDQWIIDWHSALHPSILIDSFNDTSQILCQGGKSINIYLTQLKCPNQTITARVPRKYYGLQGRSKTLKCHSQRQGNEFPMLRWILPKTGKVLYSPNHYDFLSLHTSEPSRHQVLSNGDLFISNITANAFGLYTCIAHYSNINITHFIHLGMDTTVFVNVKLTSILIGWLSSLGFLVTVLTIQMIRYLLNRYGGVDCSKMTAKYKTRRLRHFFDSMEQHKNSQLEWLRDNYNQQVSRVKENCLSQVERIRESYSVQTKNFSDIRDYGAQQIQTVRDQYHDQIRRVSSYSTQQLCKVRENYIFQRNRVGKFSSHQLLRLRETYKWQAQTVNKILENLPRTLNFDSCRGVGTCGRTDSIYFDEDFEQASPMILLDPTQLEAQMLNINSIDTSRLNHVLVTIPSDDDLSTTSTTKANPELELEIDIAKHDEPHNDNV